ncbi:cupin domain-containing protein [uncultured Ruthenibacterium sp.]|uniref:cupin domain-containing protein n=1 Tax=uncultured Ruthenibacterium sp. TaxID=1905347 RepID=UPI00349EDD71
MIYRKNQCEVRELSQIWGGEGTIEVTHLLEKNGADFMGKGRTFARFRLPPGSSIGTHVHKGESEIYYVLSGKGLYFDNGTWTPVQAGDVLVTKPDQEHAVVNNTVYDLDLIGLILYQ